MRIIEVRPSAVVILLGPDDALLLAAACRGQANAHQDEEGLASHLYFVTACYLDALARLAAATTDMKLGDIAHLQDGPMSATWGVRGGGGQ